MKIADFHIGMRFLTCTGQLWQCTDVGIRTILAIEFDPTRDEHWYNGPSYAVPEEIFDETSTRTCYPMLSVSMYSISNTYFPSCRSEKMLSRECQSGYV